MIDGDSRPKISAALRYKELMRELLFLRMLRGLSGGQLVPHEEAPFIAALDCCWHEMSDEEQAETEAMFIPRR